MHGMALALVILVTSSESAVDRARAERSRAEAEARELVVAVQGKLGALEVDLALARIDAEASAAVARAWRQAADKVRQEKDRAKGSLPAPLAGLELKEVDPQVAKVLGLSPGQAAYVTGVAPGSAAQAAGLASADILTALDGQPINGPAAFMSAVKKLRDDIRLDVMRSGRPVKLVARAAGVPRLEALTIGAARAADRATAAETVAAEAKSQEAVVTLALGDARAQLVALKGEKPRKIGVGVRDLDAVAAAALGLAAQGVVVTRVDADSVGSGAGLKIGDVIVTLGGVSLVDAKDFVTRVAKSLPNERLDLDVVRQGQRLSVRLGGESAGASA
jgi:S1-C subfamily serine protease